jgi:WD40 repeat protein
VRGDAGVTVWDLGEGKERARVPTGPVTALAVSPDGRFVAAGSLGRPDPQGGVPRPVEVWELATGKRTTVCAGHEEAASGLAFSPEGGTVASAGSGSLRSVRLWDAATGRLQRETVNRLSGAGAVAWSPDGATLAVASVEGVTLLDAATLRPHTALRDGAAAASAVCFSADGKMLAAGNGDGTARLWEADAPAARPVVSDAIGQEAVPVLHTPELSVVVCRRPDGGLCVWDAAAGRLRDVAVTGGAVIALSSDGRYLAAAPAAPPKGADLLPVQVFDLATLQIKHKLAAPHPASAVLAFRPGRPVLASADGARVVLWDVESGARLADHPITVRFQQPPHLRFSPDGRAVAAGDRLYAVDGWRVLASLPGDNYAFAPGGRFLAVKDRGRGAVDLIDLDTGRVREAARDMGNWSAVPAARPDGRLVAVTTPDGRVRVFDLTTGAAWSLQGAEPASGILLFSPDGRTLATVYGGSVRLWDPLTGAEQTTLRTGQVTELAFTPDGQRLAAALGQGEKRRLVCWEADPAEARRRLAVPGVVRQLLVSADGSRLAALAGQWTAAVWDRTTGERLLTDAVHGRPALRRASKGDFEALDVIGTVGGLRGPDGVPARQRRVTRLSFGGPAAVTPDGRLVVAGVGGQDKAARVIDLDGKRDEVKLEGATAPLTAAAVSPDGARAAVGGQDGGVWAWDAATGRLLFARADGKEAVRALAFSPDGRTLAGADDAGTVRLWDAAGGVSLVRWPAHDGSARALAFRRDGGLLASGGDDRAVRLWDVPGGGRRGVLEGHRGSITALLFADDGTLYSGGADQAVRWWPAP